MRELDEHAGKAARTYSAAADHYSLPSLSFWNSFGAATVARLRLGRGAAVADLCCGAGASAIPAAHAVGKDGLVIGVDVAEPLLALARSRAAAEDLPHAEFRHADALRTGLPDGAFDAVLCVFGVFFAADMTAFVTEMWRLVRPGGVLAITTWGPGLFEPANTLFWECVRSIEPGLYRAFSPWDDITTPAALTGLYQRAGVPGARAEAITGSQSLDGADSFWHVVLGSGYRATVDALSQSQHDLLRAQVLTELRSRRITSLRTDVVFGTARRAS